MNNVTRQALEQTDRILHEAGWDEAPRSEANDEDDLFCRAMETYARQNDRPQPTWTEVLSVLRSLGFRRTERPEDTAGQPGGDSTSNSR